MRNLVQGGIAASFSAAMGACSLLSNGGSPSPPTDVDASSSGGLDGDVGSSSGSSGAGSGSGSGSSSGSSSSSGSGSSGGSNGHDSGTSEAGTDASTRADAGSPPPTCGGGTAQSSDITINLSSLQQHITGFGVSSAWSGAFANASDPDYLWTTTVGAGLTLHRIRYGDSLTIAQSAVQHGVTVWMTPWGTGSGGSPGGPDTTMETNPNGCTGSMPVLTNPSNWASTLSAWVTNAKSQGVPLYAVSAENEPDSCGINQTTSYSATELATWIANDLGPAMHAIGVKVMGPETQNSCGFGNQSSGYFGAIYGNATAYGLLDIAATHQYGCSDPPAQGKNGFPDLNGAGKEYWETETTLGPSDDNIDSGIVIAQTMQSDLTQSNVNAWHYWWLYGATPAGLYDTSTKKFTNRLWAMGQYARFVRPGYTRVGTSGTPPSNVSLSAYTNPKDNTVVIVAINNNSSPTNLSFYITGNDVPCSFATYETSQTQNLAEGPPATASNSRLSVKLDAFSIVTFVGNPSNLPPASKSIGCYADMATRDLSFTAYDANAYTATDELCVSACLSAGYKYAGSQDGNQCFCGNSYGRYGTSTSCNVACTGNSGEMCGGSYANSVYATGL